MKLKEMYENFSELIANGHGEENVVITLEQPSVGARASSGIRHCMLGFDFESGQLRISPSIRLTAYDKDRDKPMLTKEQYLEGRKNVLIKCPKCGEHLTKKMKYCHRCGQRVYTKEEAGQLSLNKGGVCNVEKT